MTLTTQIKAVQKTASKELQRAEKRLAKADVHAKAAAQELLAARAEVAQKRTAAKSAEDMLKSHAGSEKVKPGPKPKAPKAVAATKGTHGSKKPGPKPKVAAKTALKTADKNDKKPSRAAQGRREVASGKRPPIKDVIAKVLGKRVMHANTVYEAIKEKGQLPNSGDPRGYIGYLLSASKVTISRGGKDVEVPLFERVHEKGRGFYKNRGVAATATTASVKTSAAPVKAAKTVATKSAAPVVGGKRTVTCKTCGQPGHNSKGHDRAVAKAGSTETIIKPAKKEAAPKAAKAPKAEAAPKAEGEKRTVKCGKCGATGHNAKGHDRAVAKTNGHTNGNGNGHSTSAEAKAEAKVEAAKVEAKKAEKAEETKDASGMSTDEILASAGIDAVLG
jgi:uncharacterized C2H2 Zn-finger protein